MNFTYEPILPRQKEHSRILCKKSKKIIKRFCEKRKIEVTEEISKTEEKLPYKGVVGLQISDNICMVLQCSPDRSDLAILGDAIHQMKGALMKSYAKKHNCKTFLIISENKEKLKLFANLILSNVLVDIIDFVNPHAVAIAVEKKSCDTVLQLFEKWKMTSRLY